MDGGQGEEGRGGQEEHPETPPVGWPLQVCMSPAQRGAQPPWPCGSTSVVQQGIPRFGLRLGPWLDSHISGNISLS